ncbi:MAG TPA: chemotaxis protein CheW [Myxococcales bacterium]|jgi:purine-binding chemotaxis protein CheW|nr:chemotaxis protein CheW [Myxococcales bacterium]
MAASDERSGSPIDWRAVHARLQRVAQEQAQPLSPERVRQVMDERARALARAPAPGRVSGGLELVAFGLGQERYAVESAYVQRLLRRARVTEVPGAPAPLRGILNLQGEVVAVFDLRPVLQGALLELTERTGMLVLGEQRAELAVPVEAGIEVVTVAPAKLHAPGASVVPVARELVRGVTRGGLVVLNAKALLSGPRFVVDAGRSAAQER